MIHHSLICLLKHDPKGSFRTTKLSSDPSIEKLRDIYLSNIDTLKYMINYCRLNHISSYRVISSMFPLSTHVKYREKCLPILEEALKLASQINFEGIHLSLHPDQFVLLSSLNDNVNEAARYDLNLSAYIAKFIPIKLVNIHVGSKNQGFSHHKKIFKKEFLLLDRDTKKLLSLENDEKSYSFLETLEIATENDVMIVPDFHHERCHAKRANDNLNLKDIDAVIYNNIDKIITLYKNKKSLPTFHISSPRGTWASDFKSRCPHADFIDVIDYPIKLKALSKKHKIDFILDIEAKFKEEAIFDLNKKLTLKQL